MPVSIKKETLTDSLESIEIWSELANYSLMQKQDIPGYSMHRILQEVIRKELQNDSQWAQYVLELLYAAYDFKYGDIDSHKIFYRLTPHVEAFLGACASSF